MTFKDLYLVNDCWEPETSIKIYDHNSLFIRLGFKCTPSECRPADEIAFGDYGQATVKHFNRNRVWLDFDTCG